MKLKKNQERHYKREDLTIVWRADRCFHAERCWRNLPTVFNAKGKPWIDPEGDTVEAIKNQIDQCPSGALSYFVPGEEPSPVDPTTATKVEVLPNGPLLVYGEIAVNKGEGVETRETVTGFCRCGASNNKPFCDGSHHRVNFEG